MDIYKEFIDDLTYGEYITLIDMYDRFKSWFKDNFPDNHIPNRFTFRDAMIN